MADPDPVRRRRRRRLRSLFAFIAFFRSRERHPNPQSTLNRLQRGFGLLSTIITAEPMLGILGTVTSIIQTFGAFKLSDTASPLAATVGIGEVRVYSVLGKTNLTHAAWICPTHV